MRKNIIIFLGICFTTFAQEVPKIFPPSPEATQMTKAIETPVNHFYGLANINIPLTTIKTDNIEIPIQLSYHSKGIQVDEIASRVGIGWSLNYGGIITRQIRDKVDELVPMTDFKLFQSSETVRRQIAERITQGSYENINIDFIPDQFYFSTPTQSGKFIFDYMDGKPLIQDFKDIKIDYTLNNNPPSIQDTSSFIITDEFGNKFYYGKSKDGSRKALNYDQSLVAYSFNNLNSFVQTNLGGQSSPNAWQLMEIETPKGNKIEFFYELEISNFIRKSYDEHKQSEGSGGNYIPPVYTSYFTKIRSYQYQLAEIRYNEGKILFVRDTNPRADLDGSQKLNEVQLYNFKNELIKRFKLEHYYSTASSDGNILPSLLTLDPTSAKRLFLNEVKEFSSSITNPTYVSYKLEYNSAILPNRFSTSQDGWGYYNSANNGHYLTFFTNGTNTVDRRVNSTSSTAGLLKKITFPTKGYTIFEYEDNQAGYDKRFEDIVTYETTPEKNVSAILSPFEYETCFNGSQYIKNFEIINDNNNSAKTVSVHFDIFSEGCITGLEMSCPYQAGVKNLKTGNFFKVNCGNYNISLEPGQYQLFVKVANPLQHDPFDMENGFILGLSWKEKISGESYVLYSGGKRIKSIKQYNFDDSLIKTKEYKYLSAGSLYGMPNFAPILFKINNQIPILSTYGGLPGSPLSTYQSNATGYLIIEEFFGDTNENNGKIQYYFTNTQDTGKYWQFPVHPPTDNEWLRGKPFITNYYKFNNFDYVLQKSVEYEYYNQDSMFNFIHEDPTVFTLKPEPVYKGISENTAESHKIYLKDKDSFRLPLFIYMSPPNQNIPNCWTQFGYSCSEYLYYKTYYLTGGFAPIKSVTETDYLSDYGINTITEHFYNTQNHYQLSRKTSTTSIGETVESKYFYASDLGNQILNDAHIKAVPLVTQTFRNSDKLSEQETIFVKDATTANLPLPKTVLAAKGTQNKETKITYNSYDDKGNLTQYTIESGITVTILWGYNKTQPIAKLENAKYADVQQYEANLQTLSNGTDENALLLALNTLRSNFPNAMVTTFTHKPLVGVNTITDPKGEKVTYQYDEFNRLKQVVDHNGNILNENQYNYRPQ
ncbi:RHS repeat domain-containing protein [Flavobacterium sp. H122]|uniref:RHS repeat domain-containing protein n=1 Tax=Flavobacterium sp. H122 TaxID=2529860 RepID=UPI0010AAAC06|nr:RHS repeat domain-containing protein [Flavobacterium sp. H122]